jgi:hypothetical protein
MDLSLKLTGRCCDLALHPISAYTADIIRELGRNVYKKKYINWWRNGNHNTTGMKFDDETMAEVKLGDAPKEFEGSAVAKSAVTLRRRMYLESKAKYLCLLGYDDELCSLTWTWSGVAGYDPAKFEFMVQRWDRILKKDDFLIIDDIRYDGQFADKQEAGNSCGFTLVDPMVIDLTALRAEIKAENRRLAA